MTILKAILKPEEYEHIKKELIFDDLDTIQVQDLTIKQLNSMGLILFKYANLTDKYVHMNVGLATSSLEIIAGRCFETDQAIF
jgi:D-lyxose ketol-isomerase